MRAEWPAPEAAKAEAPDKQESEAVERPAETPAMKRARDRHENERACQEALMERMRAIQTTRHEREVTAGILRGLGTRFPSTLSSSSSRNPMPCLERGAPTPPEKGRELIRPLTRFVPILLILTRAPIAAVLKASCGDCTNFLGLSGSIIAAGNRRDES